MPTASINGIDIGYQVLGDGPTVVWGHGLMGSIARERELSEGVDGLEDRGFRVVSYDARGHGASGFTADEEHYTWAAHAQDLLELLRHLEIDRAHVAGGSMGAGVAITLALAHPEVVERLVLVAPPPLADTIGPAQQLFGAFATLIETVGLERAVETAMQMPAFAVLEESQPEEYARLRDWLLSQHPRAVVFAIRGLLGGPPLPKERFHEIKAPTLIVAHPDDPIHPLSSAEKLQAAIEGSRLVVAPEIMYFEQNRGELMEIVAAFLRGEAVGKGFSSR